jgi:tRNA uridine 5-carboxymethylaminomethyl modification enzyme
VDRLRAYENTIIPDDFDYSVVDGLSNEVKQKLTAARPQTLARAARISGITPAAISLVLIYLKKRGVLKRLQEDAPEQQAS